MMSGASERAVQAAKDHLMGRVLHGWQELEEGLAAAHDPALGPDRSVCLRDVIEALHKHEERDESWTGLYSRVARILEREFGGGS